MQLFIALCTYCVSNALLLQTMQKFVRSISILFGLEINRIKLMHISYANERIIFEAIGVIESMASTPLNFHNEFKIFLKLNSDFAILQYS